MVTYIGIVAAVIGIYLLGRWADKKGWTRFHNYDRYAVGESLSAFDEILNAQRNKAAEYVVAERNEMHGGQHKAGDDKEAAGIG